MMLDVLHCDAAGVSGRVHRKLVLMMLSQLLATSKEEAEERLISVSEEMNLVSDKLKGRLQAHRART
jgi:hypothetical protein